MPTGLAPEIVHFTPHGLGQQETDSIGGPDFMVKPQVSIGLHSSAVSWLLSQPEQASSLGLHKVPLPLPIVLQCQCRHICC